MLVPAESTMERGFFPFPKVGMGHIKAVEGSEEMMLSSGLSAKDPQKWSVSCVMRRRSVRVCGMVGLGALLHRLWLLLVK